MAIVHDAYLFDPENFISAIQPYLDILNQDKDGYTTLRSAAIHAYDHNPQVRLLAAEYGGWDRNAITTQLPAYSFETLNDIGFWLNLLLYDRLQFTHLHELGLGHHWRLMQHLCNLMGWNKELIRILIEGYEFIQLAHQVVNHKQQAVRSSTTYLNYIQASSPSGHIGWISHTSSKQLFEKLITDQGKLPHILTGLPEASENLKKVYKAALTMVQTAVETQLGLYIILSG